MAKKKTKPSQTHRAKQMSQPAQKQTVQPGLSPRKRAAQQAAARRQRASRMYFGIAGVVLIGLIALAIYIIQNQAAQPSATASLPAEISVQEAHEKYQADAFLLDVREPDEWEEYHVPNTTLIPLGQLESRVSELPRDKEIVVVCRSGNRSQEGRDILIEAGFENVTSMAGGVSEWRQAGFPIETGSP